MYIYVDMFTDCHIHYPCVSMNHVYILIYMLSLRAWRCCLGCLRLRVACVKPQLMLCHAAAIFFRSSLYSAEAFFLLLFGMGWGGYGKGGYGWGFPPMMMMPWGKGKGKAGSRPGGDTVPLHFSVNKWNDAILTSEANGSLQHCLRIVKLALSFCDFNFLMGLHWYWSNHLWTILLILILNH